MTILRHNKPELSDLKEDYIIQGAPEKNAQSLCTTILQPHVTASCGFQQNVQKEINCLHERSV